MSVLKSKTNFVYWLPSSTPMTLILHIGFLLQVHNNRWRCRKSGSIVNLWTFIHSGWTIAVNSARNAQSSSARDFGGCYQLWKVFINQHLKIFSKIILIFGRSLSITQHLKILFLLNFNLGKIFINRNLKILFYFYFSKFFMKHYLTF